MKRIALVLLVLISFILVACDVTPPAVIDTIKGQLNLTFADGDSSQSVTNNFNLPTSIGDATITWESSDTSAITIVGSIAQVTRKEADANVTLSAEITLDDATRDKYFSLVVKALDEDTTYYTITWIIDGVETTSTVEEDTLPTHVNPSKTGHTFVGWNPTIVSATANATYTAVFELNQSNPSEIDGAALDLLLGASIYNLLPDIFSEDYEFFDDSSEEYPVDIYIDLFDWTEADYLAFEALLDATLELDEEEIAYIVGDFFIYIWLDELSYEVPVYSINIYSVAEGGIPNPTDDEIDGDMLDTLLGASIYDLLPAIYSSDYDFFDDSSDEYPVDIYIDLFDWDDNMAFDYEDALDATLVYDDQEEAYTVSGFFIYIYLEETAYDVPVYSINIYKTPGGTIDPEPGADGEISIVSKYSTNHSDNVSNGNINNHFNIQSGGPSVNVDFAKNNSTTLNIFNNAAQQVRLYPGSTNGSKLTITIEEGYQFTGILITIGDQNGGLSINGSASSVATKTTINVTFDSPLAVVTLQNVANATSGNRIDIASITLYYGGGEEPQLETWADAINSLENLLKVNPLDEAFPEISGLTQFNINSVMGGNFILSAQSTGPTAETLVSGYITTLLDEGWVLDEELSNEDGDVYVYEINPTLALKATFESDIQIIYIKVGKFNPNLVEGELNTLSDVQSITDMELAKFGKSGLPSSGTYDVLVIPIEIKGTLFPADYLTKLDLVFNGNEAQTGWESVSSYYQQSSFGQLNLTFDIANKYTTTQNKAFYNSNTDADLDIIDEALTALESTIDFTQYDFNNDGVIDSIIFIYSVAYDDSDNSPWWAWVYTMESTIDVDGKDVEYYMWASYSFMTDSIPGYSALILNAETYIHELGHLLGLPDLYSGTHSYGPLGGWDMMDYNVGDHGPANKLLYGWLKPLVATTGEYQVTLDSYSKDSDGMNSALLIPYSGSNLSDGDAFDEYLLVVFYTPGGLYNAHYNTTLSVEDAGIVVYHVDARLNNSFSFWGNYFRVDNDGTSNLFINLLEADGNNSIPSNSGSGYIKQTDLLTNGTFNLATNYDWIQGGDINVSITIASVFNNNSDAVTLTVSVN